MLIVDTVVQVVTSDGGVGGSSVLGEVMILCYGREVVAKQREK